MMHMTFYWGKQVTLLFNFWKTQTWIEYSLTLLFCILFSIFYQYLENLRVQIQSSSSSITVGSAIETPLLIRYTTKLPGGEAWAWRFAGAVMFGVNSAIGYMLMLAVMSFNGGVLIAVSVGLAIGYLLFRSDGSSVVAVENACACA